MPHGESAGAIPALPPIVAGKATAHSHSLSSCLFLGWGGMKKACRFIGSKPNPGAGLVQEGFRQTRSGFVLRRLLPDHPHVMVKNS
jgi:hypothetical protein